MTPSTRPILLKANVTPVRLAGGRLVRSSLLVPDGEEDVAGGPRFRKGDRPGGPYAVRVGRIQSRRLGSGGLGAVAGGAKAGADAVCPEGAVAIPAAGSSPSSKACTAALVTSWTVAWVIICSSTRSWRSLASFLAISSWIAVARWTLAVWAREAAWEGTCWGDTARWSFELPADGYAAGGCRAAMVGAAGC